MPPSQHPATECVRKLASVRWQIRIRLNRLDDLMDTVASLELALEKLREDSKLLEQRLLLLDPQLLADENASWHRWLVARMKRRAPKR